MATLTRRIWDGDARELGLYLALIAATLGLYAFKRQIRILWTVLQIDGPAIYPILGNANYILRKDLLDVMSHTAYKDYGPVSRFWITVLPYVVLFEPDHVQAVLGSAKHSQKIYFYRLMSNFLGKGLITSDVQTWRRHRRILQPAFHLQALRGFVDSFAECAQRLAQRLQQHLGQQLDITGFVNDGVYEILNETVLGVKLLGGRDELPFRKGQMLVPYRLSRPWLLFDWVYRLTRLGRLERQQSQELASACRRVMEEARRRRAAGAAGSSPRSLLDYMLEASERSPGLFGDEDIIDECSTFMLAGQDSVGTATAVTLFLLANHAEWRDRCVRELDDIFRGQPERPASVPDLKAMRWLECCIKEALRLYPSVPIFARTLGEDVDLGKHVIPAGCGVMILPYATHRLPHHFSDPHSFRPERFSPDNSEKRHPYAYLPFSAGPRNCIGNKFAILEMKAMISAILRRFHLEGVQGKTELRPKFRLTVRASGGLWLKISRRPDHTADSSAT